MAPPRRNQCLGRYGPLADDDPGALQPPPPGFISVLELLRAQAGREAQERPYIRSSNSPIAQWDPVYHTPAEARQSTQDSDSSQVTVSAATMQAITDVIEGWVREHPEQWLWVHRRWR